MLKLILYWFKALNITKGWVWTTYESDNAYLCGWTKGKDTWLKIRVEEDK